MTAEGAEPAPRLRQAYLIAAAVAVVAASLRVWTLWEQRDGNALLTLAILDDRSYLELAAAMKNEPSGQPWFLAPLFPWVLSLFSPYDGWPTMLQASVVNLVFGSLAAGVTALAAHHLAGRTAACVAGAAVALGGTFVFHDILPGQEPLLCLLHAAGVLYGVQWCRGGGRADAVTLGVVTGFACLGRALSLSLAIAAIAVAWSTLRPRARFWSGAALVGIGLAFVLGPAAVRNLRVTGELTPFASSSGVNLYMSNGPVSRERVMFAADDLPMSPDAMRIAAREIAEGDAGGPLSPSGVSSYWRGRAFEGASVFTMGLHWAKKAYLFVSADEYGNNHDVSIERRYSTWLRFFPVGGWWLLALGAAGWLLARRRHREVDVAAVVVALTWLALIVFFPVSRYRLPALVPCAIALGAGVAVLARGGVDRGRLGMVSAMALALIGLAFSGGLVRPPVNSSASYVNLATAFEHQGKHAAWLDIAEEGVERCPKSAELQETLGRAYLAAARPDLALTHLDLAGKDAVTAQIAGIRALAELNRGDDAERLADGIAPRVPGHPNPRAEYHANRALAAHARGERGASLQRLAEAAAIVPDHPAVLHARSVIDPQ